MAVVEIKVPSPGESITEVEIGALLVENGAAVEMDEEIIEIESDKATLTIVAEADGVVELLVEEGDVVQVGQIVAKIDAEGAVSAAPKAEASDDDGGSEETPAKEEESGYAKGHPSVSADKMMKENQLNAGDVEGSGRDGRITKTDVVNHLKNRKEAPKKEAPKKEASKKEEKRPLPGLPQAGGGGSERSTNRERMSRLRRKVAERLVSVKNETAMLTTFNEVDMYEIKRLRSKYKEKFKETHGVGLGFMSFFIKACTMALQEFPAVNAQMDEEANELIFHNYVDMGIAVSTPRGLVVPNIRNAEQLTLAEIEQSVLHYALKARENGITLDDMNGGTFTITNGGIFGSMLSTPIINPPQVAILGMHNIVDRPVAIDGKVEIRPIMYLALSYDHRIIDGKEAVSFLYRVKERLEDPARLMLGV